ncbi:hypothetical protein EGW08_009766, partial [Elysia chlorotica]
MEVLQNSQQDIVHAAGRRSRRGADNVRAEQRVWIRGVLRGDSLYQHPHHQPQAEGQVEGGRHQRCGCCKRQRRRRRREVRFRWRFQGDQDYQAGDHHLGRVHRELLPLDSRVPGSHRHAWLQRHWKVQQPVLHGLLADVQHGGHQLQCEHPHLPQHELQVPSDNSWQGLAGYSLVVDNNDNSWQGLAGYSLVVDNNDNSWQGLAGYSLVVDNNDNSWQGLAGYSLVVDNNDNSRQGLAGYSLVVDNNDNSWQGLAGYSLVVDNNDNSRQGLAGYSLVVDNNDNSR